jgi:hypothetical protein
MRAGKAVLQWIKIGWRGFRQPSSTGQAARSLGERGRKEGKSSEELLFLMKFGKR